MLLALVLGFLLGYLGTIPAAGPLAILVVSSVLAGHRRRRLLLSIGGAAAEGVWAFAAASGLGWFLEAHPGIDRGLRIAGSALAVIAGLALALSRAQASASPGDEPRPPAASALATGFLLVALNPSFLVGWLGSCALVRAHPLLAPAVSPRHAIPLAIGAMAGVVSWFATLDRLLGRHRERFAAWRSLLIRALGCALVIGGAVGLVRWLR
jgi:threonine/homoserine/homoserine lactone efflux protein